MVEILQLLLLIMLVTIIAYSKWPILFRQKSNGIVVLDSCAVIDGRIIELAKIGFLSNKLIVPDFIVAELQLLADGADAHKRERARFGLEVIKQLQDTPGVDLEIEKSNVIGSTTDDKLVEFAKRRSADLYTTDFNLNQVASIKGVRVLNVNELAHAIRPIALPGDKYVIKILQGGSSRDQGVGYLEDGTMIVVEDAGRDIGKAVEVGITRTHQTVAGKMLFAKKLNKSIASRQQKNTDKTGRYVYKQAAAKRKR